MSSFRIDRQYVTYIPAETQPVHVSGSRSISESVDAELRRRLEAVNFQAKEIIRNARNAAQEKTEQILARARAEAENIEAEARRKAEEIIKEAQDMAGEIREEARMDGYAQGLKAAKAEAEARKAQEAIQLQQLENKLKSQYRELVDSIHEDAVSLIMEVAKKIINVKLEESDEVFMGLVNDALDRLKETGTVIIHVGSEDYKRYFDNQNPVALSGSADAKVIVVEEESYSPGDLVVESEGEVLNYSIRRQLEKVEKAFF
ncbi:MAG: FliH/SctL family protein [Oscillospiraceae bacterium]|jgi:flagellar assembly protein FliH